MNNAQIRVCARAAMLGRQGAAAAVFLVFLTARLLWGFMTASVRLLLCAPTVRGALAPLGSYGGTALELLVCCALLLAGVFAAAPARLGTTAWFLLGAMNKKARLHVVADSYHTGRALRAVGVVSACGLFRALTVFFFCLPGTALAAGGVYMLFSAPTPLALVLVLFCGSLLLLAVGAGFAAFASERYCAAPYIAAVHPEMPVREVLRESERIMRGRYFSLARLKLGFLPWLLCCLLVFPALFVWPYYRQACAVWMLETMRKYKN